MTKNDLQTVKDALVAAGVEIYRTVGSEIQLAERIRVHLMDAGVRVVLEDSSRIVFTVRSQRSDFPHESPEALLARVREAHAQNAAARGFVEMSARTTEVRDPSDDNHVLDVWHEIAYAKQVDDLHALVEEAKWALAIEKYLQG